VWIDVIVFPSPIPNVLFPKGQPSMPTAIVAMNIGVMDQ
jgi:hypothetical protein